MDEENSTRPGTVFDNTYAHTHTYTHTHPPTHTLTHTHTITHKHTHTYTHLHTHTLTHTHTPTQTRWCIIFMALNPCVMTHEVQSWALSVFLNCFNNKKWFFCIFNPVNNLSSKLIKCATISWRIFIFCIPGTNGLILGHANRNCLVQSWALAVFFNFFYNKKWFVTFFVKLIWLGVVFLNRTGAEIVY